MKRGNRSWKKYKWNDISSLGRDRTRKVYNSAFENMRHSRHISLLRYTGSYGHIRSQHTRVVSHQTWCFPFVHYAISQQSIFTEWKLKTEVRNERKNGMRQCLLIASLCTWLSHAVGTQMQVRGEAKQRLWNCFSRNPEEECTIYFSTESCKSLQRVRKPSKINKI